MYKGYHKTFAVIVASLLISVLFCIPASAETVETVYTDFWTLSTADSKVWILDTDEGGTLTDITENVKFATLSSGKIMGVEFKANQNWGANNILYFNFYFDMRTEYANPGVSSLKFTLYQWNGGRVLFSGTGPNVNTGVSYVPWSYRDGQYYIDGVSRRDYQETYSEPNSAKNAVTFQFNNQNAEYGFNRVCVFAYCTLVESLADSNYKVYFELAGLDYRYSTMGEYLNMQIVENQNYNTDKIISNADKNASDIQANADKNADEIQANADKNASQIQQNQDKNTQSIIDNQNDLYEQEKQEISDAGNQATDAADNIPDKSGGFIDALGTFVKTMSTTSTECKMTFPQIKVPAVPMLWSEKVLSEENEVDISAAVGLIPEKIMKLIQAITTIALIVFCFKEFYDTISEALTRKKASADG